MKSNLGQLLQAIEVLDQHAKLARGPNWEEMVCARQSSELLRKKLTELWDLATKNAPLQTEAGA